MNARQLTLTVFALDFTSAHSQYTRVTGAESYLVTGLRISGCLQEKESVRHTEVSHWSLKAIVLIRDVRLGQKTRKEKKAKLGN
jgi:hypothetical protein